MLDYDDAMHPFRGGDDADNDNDDDDDEGEGGNENDDERSRLFSPPVRRANSSSSSQANDTARADTEALLERALSESRLPTSAVDSTFAASGDSTSAAAAGDSTSTSPPSPPPPSPPYTPHWSKSHAGTTIEIFSTCGSLSSSPTTSTQGSVAQPKEGEIGRGAKRRADNDIPSGENCTRSHFSTRCASPVTTAIILTHDIKPFCDSLRSSQVQTRVVASVY